MEWLIAYITARDVPEGQALATHLLTHRLVACVNVFQGCQSLYWWQGKIENSTEVVLVCKTRADKKDQLREAIERTHSYECPCVLFLPIRDGNPKYLNWLAEQLEPKT